MLKEVKISTQYEVPDPRVSINYECRAICEIFTSFIKKIQSSKVEQVLIQISDKWQEKIPMFGYYGNSSIYIRYDFDFEYYLGLTNRKKKFVILELLLKGLMQVAQREGWKKDSILDAYNSCKGSDMVFRFDFHNKNKSSPSRQLKFGLYSEWDIDNQKLFGVVFNKSGKELDIFLIAETHPSRGEYIYYLKWKWLNKSTVELSDTYRYGLHRKWHIDLNGLVLQNDMKVIVTQTEGEVYE